MKTKLAKKVDFWSFQDLKNLGPSGRFFLKNNILCFKKNHEMEAISLVEGHIVSYHFVIILSLIGYSNIIILVALYHLLQFGE